MVFVLEVYIPCLDKELLEIFEEEKQRKGLKNLDIQLLVPENDHYFNDATLADASGSQKSWYDIVLYPRNIDDSFTSYRSTIRHELAHIKHGDLDRNFPSFLKKFWNFFVEEPRARLSQLL